MPSNDTIQQLTHLVHANRDAEAGFRTAAENVSNSELETLFTGYAKQHAKFEKELQAEADRLGGGGLSESSLGGALHRGWTDLKAALSGHSARSVLAACENEAQSLEAAYAEADTKDFTGHVGSLLAKQQQQVKEMHKHLCRLLGETKDGVTFQANE